MVVCLCCIVPAGGPLPKEGSRPPTVSSALALGLPPRRSPDTPPAPVRGPRGRRYHPPGFLYVCFARWGNGVPGGCTVALPAPSAPLLKKTSSAPASFGPHSYTLAAGRVRAGGGRVLRYALRAGGGNADRPFLSPGLVTLLLTEVLRRTGPSRGSRGAADPSSVHGHDCRGGRAL